MAGRWGGGKRGPDRAGVQPVIAPQPNVEALEAEARRLHALRLSLIPIRNRGDKKAPAGEWNDAKVTARSLTKVLEGVRRRGVTGIGVVTGSVSDGLCCRDFDRADVYHSWAAAFPDWARVLPTVETVRGFHVYFRAEKAIPTRKVEGGELRGERVYTVLPPSLHPSGVVYRWLIEPGADGFPSVDPLECGLVSEKKHDAPPLPLTSVDHEDPKDPVDHEDPVDPVKCEEAVVRYRVTGQGEHDACTRNLVRALKLNLGVPDLLSARPWFDKWWELSKAHASESDPVVAWDKFARFWVCAVVPIGGRVAVRVVATVRDLPPVAEERGEPVEGLRLLIRAVVTIGLAHKGEPFILTAREVAQIAGCSPRWAGAYMRQVASRVRLELIDRGKAGKPGQGRGARYRLLPSAPEDGERTNPA